MAKMRKLWLFLFLLPISLLAQTTTVTGTVTDPDGFLWVGGSVNFTLYNAAGGTVKQNGVPLTPAQMNQTVALNGAGAFSVGLADNTTLTPIGTQWTLLVCPAASAPCQTLPRFTASGSSLSLTTAISSQLQALRFPASYTARGYGDIEISPLPPPGGTYYSLPTGAIRFWNGTVWAAMGSGGGGGSNPSAPTNSVQASNAGQTAFISDPNILIDNVAHSFNVLTNATLAALSNTSIQEYDPNDTKFDGGLAAAVAGTSGFTPTQVIQATIDYGRCQQLTGAAPGYYYRVKLPPGPVNNISQVLLWANTDFGGTSMANQPRFQHIDATKPMIAFHGNSDTLTCNSTVYTPGAGGGNYIHNIAVSGMGAPSSPQDIAIYETGQANIIWQITGYGNSFGAQVILSNGINNFIYWAGYPGAQLSGCWSFTRGIIPVSSAITGSCGAVQDQGTDDEVHFVYSTDAAEQLTGKGPGSCYPNCAAVITGTNVDASELFPQISDINVIIGGQNGRVSIIRGDASSAEGIRINGSGNTVDNIQLNGECLSSNYTTNWNAGTQTGCYGIFDTGQGNQVSIMQVSEGTTFFGTSQTECQIGAGSSAGPNSASNTYGFNAFQGNPGNTTLNSRAFCYGFDGSQASGRVVYPAMAPMVATTSTINISGLTNVYINTTTPVTALTGGTPGQEVDFQGTPGASIVPGGSLGGEYIATCNSLPEVFDGFRIVKFINVGGYRNGFGPDTRMQELCNNPNLSPLHVAWNGQTAPSNPSMSDLFGNVALRQMGSPTGLDLSTIHAPVISGNECFEEELVYSDGSDNVTPIACTSADLSNQSPGGVNSAIYPFVVSYNLYLVTNTTSNGVPTGKFPQPAVGGGGGFLYWDGVSVLAHGGDGTTAPPPSRNNTGMLLANWGVDYTTYNNTQPPCDITTRGRVWLLGGLSGNPDVLQQCIQLGTGTYGWQTIGGTGGVPAGVIAMGTSGGGLTSSHLNETANAGYDTFTQGVVVQDSSGNGANMVGSEGTEPASAVGCGVTGNDCFWADSTQHQWLVSNNGGAVSAMATIPTASPITAGHCVMGGTGNDQLADAGAACSSGGGVTPGTPTLQIDAGAGTAPTITLSTGASDFSGFLNITFGTCSGGLCPVPTTGIVDVRNSKFATGGYSPQLKCFIEPANVAAMALSNTQQLFTPLSQQTALKFTVISNTTAIAQSTGPYIYYYHCDYQ